MYEGSSIPQVGLNGFGGRLAVGDNPLFAPLSEDTHEHVGEVAIGEVERDELSDTESRGIEKLQNRSVAATERSRLIGALEEALYFDLLDSRRDLLVEARG